MVQCDGDPCDGATCPSHLEATCTPNYCGSCRPQWSIGDAEILCHGMKYSNSAYRLCSVLLSTANFSDFCLKPVNNTGKN